MTALSVEALVVRYGVVTAVDGVSFSVGEGEFVSLLGPSGCGKTTTLRCVAGLESASGGTIRIGADVVARDGFEMPPEQRGVNMVFQSYAVWPHMTVFQNVAYGVRGRPDVTARVTEALRLVGLGDFAGRYGTELSGGQQQRVAVARAVVTEPRLLLFDEPLSNLDAGLRERMRFELLALQRRLGRTSLYVTHDQAEAMAMSDRIILMDRGRIVQVGTPRELYERPASRFAASFIGNANLLEGRVTQGLADGWFEVALDGGLVVRGRASVAGWRPAGRVLVCVRPQDVAVDEEGFAARCLRVSYLGTGVSCAFTVGDLVLRVDLPARLEVSEGDEMRLRFDAEAVVLVPME